MRHLTRAVLGIAATVVLPRALAAQFPPTRLENVKVLPKEMPVRALVDTMASFTRALGVRCTYCHVGREGEPLANYDFKSDEKPEKEKAREMLRMVAAINGDHLPKLASRRTPPIAVSCATCHRGVAEPRTLQQRLVAAYDAAGADSAEKEYRALRERYYGRASYDFGEVPLTDLGAVLRSRGKLADAVRFYVLNTQFLPTSLFALRQAADAQIAAGDTAAAESSLRKVLAISAADAQARAMLTRIGRTP